MHTFSRRQVTFSNMDWQLFAVAIGLAGLGVAVIYSATHAVEDLVVQNRWIVQLAFLLMGVVVFFAGALVDYRLLSLLGVPSFLLLLILLVLVERQGVNINGSVRWLDLPGGIRVQPSEAGKFMLIVIMAWFLSRYYTDRKRLYMLLLGLAALALPLFLVYRQPDLGMTVTMLFIVGAMVLMSGLPVSQALILALLGISGAWVLFESLSEYQLERLDIFFFHRQTENQDAAFNVRQALIGVGNGGLFGKGWLEGTQSQLFFLRVRHTDFIFSVIAEEFGFLGCAGLLGAVGFMLFRLVRTMDRADDEFGRLLVGGVGALILFQFLINVGMNLRLAPVTGMTLPFISSGGSSLISMMFALGLAQSVNLRRST